jgi:hypothetical protein
MRLASVCAGERVTGDMAILSVEVETLRQDSRATVHGAACAFFNSIGNTNENGRANRPAVLDAHNTPYQD